MEEEISGAAAEATVTSATEAPEAQRRGRGRPRKSQQVLRHPTNFPETAMN